MPVAIRAASLGCAAEVQLTLIDPAAAAGVACVARPMQAAANAVPSRAAVAARPLGLPGLANVLLPIAHHPSTWFLARYLDRRLNQAVGWPPCRRFLAVA